MPFIKLTLPIVLLLVICSFLEAQSLFTQTNLSLEADKTEYKISNAPIVHHSEKIMADSLLLVSGVDYSIDYQKGQLHLIRFPDSPLLSLQFILVPEFLTQPVQRYEIQVRSDSLFTRIKRRNLPLIGSDNKLDIKGSKTFAITFSDDQAFDLKQSLYVNLSGELAKGVSLDAQLSDSQSKLSPEGDSKELSSLDRVFIKVHGDHYEIAMGDLDIKYENSRYMEYFSKFEGLNFSYKNRNSIQGAYSAGNGKAASLTLPIIDGKQGPYYLRPNDYQPGFMVVAGSEEVFVDGTRWERGGDYSIDYSEGSLMFKRLISSSNSVLVRFQYSDEYYPVTNYLNSSLLQINDSLSLRHHFIWQQDSKKNPLASPFTQADLDSLNLAGDNVVWGNGIALTETGTGDYKLVSGTGGIQYFEYAPGDSLANYAVVFSFVGSGNGDYQEFSSGKFRYAGSGMGSWLPQKRLIPPNKKANLDLNLEYATDVFKTGIETLGSLLDRNTLSDLDDKDNLGGIVYGYLEIPGNKLSLRLDHEQRSADTSLFGKYRNPDMEFDFSALANADSLAQQESNFSLAYGGQFWKSSLLLRYKEIYELYSQKALRLTSSSAALGLLPSVNLRGTLSEQREKQSGKENGMLQYYQGDASWTWKTLRLKLDGLFNGLDQKSFGTAYLKYGPQLSLGKASACFLQLAYSEDDTRVKNQSTWTSSNQSRTYALKNLLNLGDQRLDLDFTHRELEQPQSTSNPKSGYDLMNLRSHLSVLKQMLSLYTNYQLNQTEFFPKIRELQYIGNGLGLYDSTGVSTPDGDYDYVFITSSNGELSSEISALFTLYAKPGNYLPGDFWKRWQLDSTLNLNEQSLNRDNWQSYLFWPGEVFSETSTIYGRQNLMQTLWLELIRNRLNANLQLEVDRTLDKRYQTVERTFDLNRVLQLDFTGLSAFKTRLQYSNSSSEDSRYLSQTGLQSLSAVLQKNLSPQSNLQAELSYSLESGKKQDGSEAYSLKSLSVSPTLRSVWMQKYRLSGSFSLTRNILEGSSYFSFLPAKRNGWIPALSLNGMYRLNSFSSITLDYRFSDYPSQKSNHELKLEFKAEL